MKLVAISDVHERWDKLVIPECDILISAGDYSYKGAPEVVEGFHSWLSQQPAKHVISVQGNHELWVEKNFEEAKAIAEKACPGVHFIDEGLINIEGIKIWGSAITPWFHNWAWNKERGDDIKKHWDIIPDDINILVTHGPPYGILDLVYQVDGVTPRERVGCFQLEERIRELKDLKLHIFGHIHCNSGERFKDGVHFINACICDEMYYPSNPIRIVEI